MKQLIVLAFLCLAGTHFADAQVKKGNVLAGGTAGVKWEKTDYDDRADPATYKSTQYVITPRVGYAFKDNWVAGIAVTNVFNKGKSELENGHTSGSAYILSTGVFVRRYTMIGGNVGLFGEAGAYYSHGSSKQNEVQVSSSNNYSIGVAPGIAYFVNKRWMVEGTFGGLNYGYTKFTDIINNRKSTASGLSFDFGQQFELGVAFLF